MFGIVPPLVCVPFFSVFNLEAFLNGFPKFRVFFSPIPHILSQSSSVSLAPNFIVEFKPVLFGPLVSQVVRFLSSQNLTREL